MSTRRYAIWLGSLFGLLLYLLILTGPILGGIITAEQIVSTAP